MSLRNLRASLPLPARRKGQSTIEYVLLVGIVSVPFSYGMWYVFFHSAGFGRPPRIVEFLQRIIDFVSW